MFGRFKKILGIPDGTAEAGSDRQDREFVCETELTQRVIHASVDAGTLHEWRVDDDGFQWYRRGAESAAISADDQTPCGGDDVPTSDAPFDWEKFDSQFADLDTEIEAASVPFDRVAFDQAFEDVRERCPDPGFDRTPEFGTDGDD